MEYWPSHQGSELNLCVAQLFAKTRIKCLNYLCNVTSQTMPIDVLFYTKRYQLFQIILNELEKLVLEKITSRTNLNIIKIEKYFILDHLLHRSTHHFFTKCHRLQYASNQKMKIKLYINFDLQLIRILSNFFEIVFAFLLFGSSNKIYMTFGKKVLVAQVEILFENLIIDVSNCIIDALLRNSDGISFAFQNYIFDNQYYSIRKIEQIRNNLMWYKFMNQYINIPKNIYENKYSIWIISPKGILAKKISAYRLYELSYLSTNQLIITFILEIQDFLLPKIYALIQFLIKTIFFFIYKPIQSKIELLWRYITNDFS
uniref:hypothetical protein n=1 Tax=Rhodaphanes brevistipitata TaxID=446136 RepID=UPI001FCCDEC4|nr:hypothetical protein MW432_pgp156 [Rhodaphanes brevistipitata]UNJ18425.1 hypothetical protein [Rhodaphanes brevistipitata]